VTKSSDPGFLDALAAVNQALDDIDAPSMVIGGVAVIALGVARLTVDIDATIQGRSSDPERVLKVFAQHDIHPRIVGASEFARSRQVVLARHHASGVSIDASLAWLPFEEEAIQFSQIADYSGIPIRVPRPEDLVIYKLVAGRPQDIDDVEKLLALYKHKLDLDQIRTWIQQFSEVLEGPDRRVILKQLLKRVS
jgi:predicted nucleotidyltransferase